MMDKSHSYQMLINQLKNGNVIQSENVPGSFCCLLCNCSISGQSQAESHVVGGQHAKKLLEKIFAPQAFLNDHEPNTITSQDFNCKLCGVGFSGPIPFNQHLQGKLHRKKELASQSIKQEEIPATLPNITSKSIQTTPPPIANIGRNPSPDSSIQHETFCKLCSIELTGRIPMEAHLKGKPHQRKLLIQSQSIKQEEIPATPPNITSKSIQTTPPPIANTGRNSPPDSSIEEKTFCEICCVEISGRIPMQQHLRGKPHQKKLLFISSSTKLDLAPKYGVTDSKLQSFNSANVNAKYNCSLLEAFDSTQSDEKSCSDTNSQVEKTISPNPKSIFTVDEHEPLPKFF